MTSHTNTRSGVLQLRIDDDTTARLDDLRRAEDDLPSRSEMIRRLIARAAEELATDTSVGTVIGRRQRKRI